MLLGPSPLTSKKEAIGEAYSTKRGSRSREQQDKPGARGKLHEDEEGSSCKAAALSTGAPTAPGGLSDIQRVRKGLAGSREQTRNFPPSLFVGMALASAPAPGDREKGLVQQSGAGVKALTQNDLPLHKITFSYSPTFTPHQK